MTEETVTELKPHQADVQTPPPSALVMQLVGGFQFSQAAYVIVDTGVATILEQEGPQTVEKLAERTGTSPVPLGRLIRTLASVGLFTTDGDQIAVTPSGALLSSKHPESMADFTQMWMETHYLPFSELGHSVRTGTPGSDKYLGLPFLDWVNQDSDRVHLFSQAMANTTTGLRIGMFDDYQLPPGHVVADLGGSDGSILRELFMRDQDENRRGILFELPTTAPAAVPVLAAAGLSDRIDIVAGDFFDSVPSADIYLLVWVMHDWADDDNQQILATIKKAAQPGARLIVIESVVPAGDAPHLSKVIDLTMLGMMTGQERTEDEYRTLLATAGFTLDRVVATHSPYSILEATLEPSPRD